MNKILPKNNKVIIIGGGIAGCSTDYHLDDVENISPRIKGKLIDFGNGTYNERPFSVVSNNEFSDLFTNIGLKFEELLSCDFVFVCVPTPMVKDTGRCFVGIVESVVSDLKSRGYKSDKIVIRSTVPIGTSANLSTCFMPEFLTEANWEEDFKNVSTRIIGMPNPKDQALSGKFLNLFYAATSNKKINESKYTFCSTKEAETIKLARNSF